MKEKAKIKGRGKGERPRGQHKEIEWWGVLFGISKEIKDAKNYIIQHTSRLIEIELKLIEKEERILIDF